MAEMDTTALGWAVQRPARDARKPASPSIRMRGSCFMRGAGRRIEKGQPLATVYATRPEMLAEPVAIIRTSRDHLQELRPTLSRWWSAMFTRENAEEYLASVSQYVARSDRGKRAVSGLETSSLQSVAGFDRSRYSESSVVAQPDERGRARTGARVRPATRQNTLAR